MSKKILIVEDEPLISDDLEIIITNLGYNVIGKADSVVNALAILAKSEVDLTILDIQLKGKEDGICLAKQINEEFQIPFVYLTSFYDDDTLFRIRETNPAGYIVKPFKDADLKANIALALNKQILRKEEDLVPANDLSLFVRQNSEMVKIDYHSIEWIKGENNYADIYYNNGKKSTVTHTLKFIDEKLANFGFVRIHKSYVINLKKVSTISGNNVFVGNDMLPIGKAYRKQFFEKLTIV